MLLRGGDIIKRKRKRGKNKREYLRRKCKSVEKLLCHSRGKIIFEMGG
jgi:hypothetical protein